MLRWLFKFDNVIGRKVRRSVRLKTLLILALSGVILLVFVQWYAGHMIIDDFRKVENDRATTDMQRIKSALDEKISSIDTLAQDWASWDDTYAFIVDRNEPYIRSNPTDETMVNAGLNLIIFLNRSNQIVFEKAVDLDSETQVPVPPVVYQSLYVGAGLMDYSSSLNGSTGIISVPEGLLLFASQPILTSQGTGPVRGMLVMGRYLDSAMVDELSEITHINIALSRLDELPMREDIERAVSFISGEEPFYIEPVNDNSIMGYALVNDVDFAPVAVLEADMPRDIFQHGRLSTNYMVASIAVCVAIVLLIAFILNDRMILGRLAGIGKNVRDIGQSGNASQRVSIKGKDEIAGLGKSINAMLASLEQAAHQLRESEARQRVMWNTIGEKTQQLEEAVRDAEKANQAKSDFLSNMSHELRTPLNAVIGFSEVLEEQYFGTLNEKQAEYIRDILESGRHLLSLINDILDLSKIEAGKMELDLSEVHIKSLLESSLVMVKEKAAKHGINMSVNLVDGVNELTLVSDERKLKQVMFNLLSNAVKFTHDGGAITVTGKKEGGEVQICVTDTGIGIAPENQKRIFEEFYQVRSGNIGKTPGTGLGLAITRRIIELHGGKIWLYSEGEGKGCSFTFAIPFQIKSA